jgi:hypothetical protein
MQNVAVCISKYTKIFYSFRHFHRFFACTPPRRLLQA